MIARHIKKVLADCPNDVLSAVGVMPCRYYHVLMAEDLLELPWPFQG